MMSQKTQSDRQPSGGDQATRQSNAKTDHDTKSQQGNHETQEKLQRVAKQMAGASRHATTHFVGEPAQDLMGLAKQYAKDKPDIAAMWCFAFGVIVGWKLRG